jgi:hypothetical protein
MTGTLNNKMLRSRHSRPITTVTWLMIALFALQALMAPVSALAAPGSSGGSTWLPSDTPYAAGSTDLANSTESERIGGCFYPSQIVQEDGSTKPSKYAGSGQAGDPIPKDTMRSFAYQVGFVTALYTTGTIYYDENDKSYAGGGYKPDKLKQLADMPDDDDAKVEDSEDKGDDGQIGPADFQGKFLWYKFMLERIKAENSELGGDGGLLVVPKKEGSGLAAEIALRNIPPSCMPTVRVDMVQGSDLKTFILHPFKFLRNLFTNIWAAVASFMYNLFSPIVWKLGFFTPHVERGETLVDVMKWDSQCFAKVGESQKACDNASLGFDPSNIDEKKIEKVPWVKASIVVRLLVTSTYFLIIAWAALVHVARPGRRSSWNLYTKLPQVILATAIVLLAPPMIGVGITLSNQVTQIAFSGAIGQCGPADGLAGCSVESQTNRVISNSGSVVLTGGDDGNGGIANSAAAWLGGFWAGPMEVRLMAMTMTGYMLASLAIYALLRQLGLVILIITLPIAATALIDEKWKPLFRVWLKSLGACLFAPPLIAIVGAIGFMVNPLNQTDLTDLTFMSRVFGLAMFCITIYAMSMVMVGLRKWAVGGGNHSVAGKMWGRAGKGMTSRRLQRSFGQSPLNRPIAAGYGRIAGGNTNSSERALSRATQQNIQTSSKLEGVKDKAKQLGVGAATGGSATAIGAAAGAAGGLAGAKTQRAGASSDADSSVIRVQNIGKDGKVLTGGLGEDGMLNVAQLNASSSTIDGKVRLTGRGATAGSRMSPQAAAAAGGKNADAGVVKMIGGKAASMTSSVKSVDARLQSVSVSSPTGGGSVNSRLSMTSKMDMGRVSPGCDSPARKSAPQGVEPDGTVRSGGWHGGGAKSETGMSTPSAPASESAAIESFKKMDEAARSITTAMGEVVNRSGYSGGVDRQKLYEAFQAAIKHHPGAQQQGSTNFFGSGTNTGS